MTKDDRGEGGVEKWPKRDDVICDRSLSYYNHQNTTVLNIEPTSLLILVQKYHIYNNITK